MQWVGSTFGAFSNRPFFILWSGTLAAFVAFFMSTAVQGVVAFDLTGKNSAVGLVIAAQGLSQGVLGPVGGAMADRVSKKLLILVCQAVITAAFAGLALLVKTDLITIVLLSAGSFAIGAAFSFIGPARNSWMVELVEPARRGNAMALNQVALNLSRILGPLMAAAVLAIGALGAGGGYATMALLYIGAIAATVSISAGHKPSGGSGRSILGDIGVGLRYVRTHRRLRLLVPSYILIIMSGFGYVTVLPGLLKNELGHDPKQITTILAVNAVGGLLASVFAAAIADSHRARPVYTTACVVFGLALIGSGFAPSYTALMAVMFFVGAGSGAFQTLNGALVSTLAEPAYLGRVMSLTFLAFALSNMMSLPFGAIADVVGERAALMTTGALVTIISAGFFVMERTTRREV